MTIYALVFATVFSAWDWYPTGQVWVYSSKAECEAALLDILTYDRDDTKRTYKRDIGEVRIVDSEGNYMATAVCKTTYVR